MVCSNVRAYIIIAAEVSDLSTMFSFYTLLELPSCTSLPEGKKESEAKYHQGVFLYYQYSYLHIRSAFTALWQYDGLYVPNDTTELLLMNFISSSSCFS